MGPIGALVINAGILGPVTRVWEAAPDQVRRVLCSTHKALAAASVLARVDRKQESLARRILYAREDLVPIPRSPKRTSARAA